MTVRSSKLYRGAMVGREHQLAQAVSLFSGLETGDSPGMLCYWAPAGIGKSRLVREIDAALSGPLLKNARMRTLDIM